MKKVICITFGVLSILLAIYILAGTGIVIISGALVALAVFLFIIAGRPSKPRDVAESYNNPLDVDNRVMIAHCPKCSRQIQAKNPAQFSTHKNFPEGFMYCPYCRKPVSIRAFTTVTILTQAYAPYNTMQSNQTPMPQQVPPQPGISNTPGQMAPCSSPIAEKEMTANAASDATAAINQTKQQ